MPAPSHPDDLALAHRLAAALVQGLEPEPRHFKILVAMRRASAISRETAKPCLAIDGANSSALRACMALGHVRGRFAIDGACRYWLTDAGLEASR
jgi:hypothetical protein